MSDSENSVPISADRTGTDETDESKTPIGTGEVQNPPPIDPADDIEAPYGRKADGTPRAKPGRKGGGDGKRDAQRSRLNSVSQAGPRPPSPPPINTPAVISADYEQLGKTAATLFFGCGEMVFGNDWAPTSADEAHSVAFAFRDYFKAKQIEQIDPTVGLMLILGSYTAVRITKPTVKSRLMGAFSWLKSNLRIPKLW